MNKIARLLAGLLRIVVRFGKDQQSLSTFADYINMISQSKMRVVTGRDTLIIGKIPDQAIVGFIDGQVGVSFYDYSNPAFSAFIASSLTSFFLDDVVILENYVYRTNGSICLESHTDFEEIVESQISEVEQPVDKYTIN